MFKDKLGNTITEAEWTEIRKQHNGGENRACTIKYDTVDQYGVSTVWIGVGGTVYETAVFDDIGSNDTEFYSWASKESALSGHQEIVDALRTGADLPPSK